MNLFKADLHIHTCLSPCGDLEMSPQNIIRQAVEKGLDIIAITDHNTTRNVKSCLEIGKEQNIFVIGGCEINTQEEVHCLAYFPDLENLDEFQKYLDENLPDIKNDPAFFGYQVAVDEFDNIIYEEKKALFAALEQNIDEVEEKVHSLGGIFVPAHIDRAKNSIFSQLGFIPFDLKYDALEISWRVDKDTFINIRPELASKKIIQSSDAHFLSDIGKVYSQFYMEKLDWESFIQNFK
ncbi:conserved hypothetical protein [uncultured Paludibacter sp.]|uniref:Polymerase/histidinol phosphatase N-terminal domain-containing protein n=1 Tax=uncultured Paludibacter sp. TaxID=497635 RepID=A0A653ACX0_9BACT|nr:conserved hypothetical protein [uncultured Paludibacter sp.]